MVQRKLLLLALVVLLLPVGMVVAQSSTNSVMQRFVMMGGGSADSANYRVTYVIGQPVTKVVDNSNHEVSGGFLFPLPQDAGFGEKIWLPVLLR